jgi:hypothetical protein
MSTGGHRSPLNQSGFAPNSAQTSARFEEILPHYYGCGIFRLI